VSDKNGFINKHEAKQQSAASRLRSGKGTR
jgi:hypothetical protein